MLPDVLSPWEGVGGRGMPGCNWYASKPMQGAHKTLPIPWPVPGGLLVASGKGEGKHHSLVEWFLLLLCPFGKMASVLSGTWVERQENAVGRSNVNATQAKSIKNLKENIASLTAAKFISVCGNLVKYIPL